MSSQSFQQILFNKRALYTPSFYGMMYETFVEIEVLNGRITAPGYIDAIFNKFRWLVVWLGIAVLGESATLS